MTDEPYKGNKEIKQVVRNLGALAAFPKSETVAIPAGAAATLKDFQLSLRPILDSTKSDLGGKGDTSLALTSTAFTTEVAYGKPDGDLANGEWYVNYVTGKGRGRKADGTTTMTATYYVPKASAPFTPSAPAVASVGVTSAEAVAASTYRRKLFLESALANTGRISLSLTGADAAVLDSGITLYPGDSITIEEDDSPGLQVRAISAVAAQVLGVQAFT